MTAKSRIATVLVAAALPAMTATTARAAEPLKVFILAGQSNMEGHAAVRTFDYMARDPKTVPILKEMRNSDGTPRVCEKVWISYLTGDGDHYSGKLTAGYGAKGGETKIGPEFTFGIYTQKFLDEPILLIKTAWGGKSLHTDFRPPSAGPYELNQQQVEQYTQRGIDLEQWKAEKAEVTGHYYRLMIDHVKEVLNDIQQVYPGYDPDQRYELAGFVWFQGWNDMVDGGTYPERNKPRRLRSVQRTAGAFHPRRPQGPPGARDAVRDRRDGRGRSPGRTQRIWRYVSFDVQRETDSLDKGEGKRFRNVALPDGMKDWFAPEFDHSAWSRGKAPIGTGTWKHRRTTVKNNSDWGDGEFLLMRTSFELDAIDCESYRLSILARQGFDVYLNGHKIHTYIWWKNEPYYRAILLTEDETKYLKKGVNVLAAYTNVHYDKNTAEPFGSIDLFIEGITSEGRSHLVKALEKVLSAEDQAIADGASNAAYHYMGSAKIMARIGKAFAEAVHEINTSSK